MRDRYGEAAAIFTSHSVNHGDCDHEYDSDNGLTARSSELNRLLGFIV